MKRVVGIVLLVAVLTVGCGLSRIDAMKMSYFRGYEEACGDLLLRLVDGELTTVDAMALWAYGRYEWAAAQGEMIEGGK